MTAKKLNPDYVNAVREIVNSTPYFLLLGMHLHKLKPGRAEFKILVQDKHLNPFGRMQGGAVASVLDAACAWAFLSQVESNQAMSTADLKTSYLDPGRPGQNLRAVGTTVKMGRRVGFCEARLTEQGSGRLLAMASATCVVLDGPLPRALVGLPPKFIAEK